MPTLVVCAVIEQNHKWLLAQRSATMRNALLWEFPGGKIEPNETAEAALVREIYEELALVVQPFQVAEPIPYPTEANVGKNQIVLVPVLANIISGSITLAEHIAFGWFSVSEMESLEMAFSASSSVE